MYTVKPDKILLSALMGPDDCIHQTALALKLKVTLKSIIVTRKSGLSKRATYNEGSDVWEL